MNDTTKPLGTQAQNVTDRAADKAVTGVRSVQQAATSAIDKASDNVDQLKDDAAPILDKVTDQAQKLVQQGREAFNDASQKARERFTQASDAAVGYTKDEPIKAMLIAAAAGAILMGLITLMARSDD